MTETPPPIQEPVFQTLYCANHPQRETLLRCNRCDKPICTQCAILTPTGYRCRECVSGQQKVFDTAKERDYLIGAVVAGGISFIGSYIVSILGIFTILVAPIVAILIDEVLRWAVQRRRSRMLTTIAVTAAAVGGLILLVTELYPMLAIIFGGVPVHITFYTTLLLRGVYAALVASSLYYRLRGITRY
jgi:hypothetical protein